MFLSTDYGFAINFSLIENINKVMCHILSFIRPKGVKSIKKKPHSLLKFFKVIKKLNIRLRGFINCNNSEIHLWNN